MEINQRIPRHPKWPIRSWRLLGVIVTSLLLMFLTDLVASFKFTSTTSFSQTPTRQRYSGREVSTSHLGNKQFRFNQFQTSLILLHSLHESLSESEHSQHRSEAAPAISPANLKSTLLTNVSQYYYTNPPPKNYNWKEFLPDRGSNLMRKRLRWIITGSTIHSAALTEDSVSESWNSLARLLLLLRAYEHMYGVPTTVGSQAQQRQLLADITRDLYAGGAPTWVVETIMERVAEGLTGQPNVDFMMLPRRCFVQYPDSEKESTSSTQMFKLSPGYNIALLDAVEQVAVRLASFASNTPTMEKVSTEDPPQIPPNLPQIEQNQMLSIRTYLEQERPSPQQLAQAIIDEASKCTLGLFYVLNHPQYSVAMEEQNEAFWRVQESTRDTFTRLATEATASSLNQIHKTIRDQKTYSNKIMKLCVALSSAGACALWFGGSFYDMAISAILSIVVNHIGNSPILAFEERILTEVLSSVVVGVVAGGLALRWPNRFSFGAIAVGSVLDILQGYKAVFGLIEVMSKNVVTGAARLLEGIMFTGLISHSLRFGAEMALKLGGTAVSQDYASILIPTHTGISPKFIPLILPFTTVAWSLLFKPHRRDLLMMALHGMMAFALNWVGVSNFFAAMCVTFSAGLISRFTGRGALGNTLSGLFALAPGGYMARALLAPNRAGFVENLLTVSAAIGLGSWCGTILCHPTILGKSSGLHGWSFSRNGGEKSRREGLVYF